MSDRPLELAILKIVGEEILPVALGLENTSQEVPPSPLFEIIRWFDSGLTGSTDISLSAKRPNQPRRRTAASARCVPWITS